MAFAVSLQSTVVTPNRSFNSRVSVSSRRFQRPSSRRTPIRCEQAPGEMPDSAKRAVASGEKVTYWQGEWICVDCGYVYKPTRRVKFEDLPGSWKCPQCNAPKRRFAKKAGDYIAETASTSNLPIIIFSIGGLIATVAFGIWASQNL